MRLFSMNKELRKKQQAEFFENKKRIQRRHRQRQIEKDPEGFAERHRIANREYYKRKKAKENNE